MVKVYYHLLTTTDICFNGRLNEWGSAHTGGLVYDSFLVLHLASVSKVHSPESRDEGAVSLDRRNRTFGVKLCDLAL